MPNNYTGGSRRQKLLNWYRFVSLALLAYTAIAVFGTHQKLDDVSVPTAAEVAQAVNGPTKFQRPGSMEYVVKTNSCIVGGTVTSSEWSVGAKTVSVGSVDPSTVGYTAFGFKADNGQVFTVSAHEALYMDPGENLGLELDCDPATMNTASSFGMVAIIYGGK